MKRLNILVLAAIGWLCGMSVSAQDLQPGGLSYARLQSNTDKKAEVVLNGAAKGTTKAVIPAKVTLDGKTYRVVGIGANTFSSQEELTSVVIPGSVISIGKEAFIYCKKLTSVQIPNSVTSMENGVFYGCSSLTSVVEHKGVPYIPYMTYCYCMGLDSVAIPDYVTRIEPLAFDGCRNMTRLHIGSQITFIGGNAFNDCGKLSRIYIEAPDPGKIKITESPFMWATYENAELYVPEESVDAYKNTLPWSRFKKIIEWKFEKNNDVLTNTAGAGM